MGGKYYELEQSIDGLRIQVGNIESQLDLSVTAEKMTAAITTAAGGQTVAVFDAEGITTYNGGFRIRIGTEQQYDEVFSVDDSGNIRAVGTFLSRTQINDVQYTMAIDGAKLLFQSPTVVSFFIIPSPSTTQIGATGNLIFAANQQLDIGSGTNNVVLSMGTTRYQISVENGFVKGTLIS